MPIFQALISGFIPHSSAPIKGENFSNKIGKQPFVDVRDRTKPFEIKLIDERRRAIHISFVVEFSVRLKGRDKRRP